MHVDVDKENSFAFATLLKQPALSNWSQPLPITRYPI